MHCFVKATLAHAIASARRVAAGTAKAPEGKFCLSQLALLFTVWPLHLAPCILRFIVGALQLIGWFGRKRNQVKKYSLSA